MTEDRRPRERMVYSAAQLLRRGGIAAVGLREVARHADAPRGSLQHYFPGGKEQVVNEAVTWAGQFAASRVPQFLAAMADPTPGALLAAMARQWTEELRATGDLPGCPVAAATADGAQGAASTRAAVAAAFTAWREPVAAALPGLGVPAARAGELATLMISALEGAILISRAERSPRALEAMTRQLAPLLDDARDIPRRPPAR